MLASRCRALGYSELFGLNGSLLKARIKNRIHRKENNEIFDFVPQRGHFV